jgi:4-hydroxybenzoate polyprenyltransferase
LSKRTSFVAWLQLLRLPNVFTTVADVAMGYLVTHGDLDPASDFALLVVVSCLLYLSGMVLNDVFDAEVDARDRPNRPIPSGRVSRKAAAIAGWAMLATGVLVAWWISFAANDWRPGAVAILLASCILLYDGALKRTRFAPLLMGECRMLNVLLGMSLFIIPWGKAEVMIAIGIGIYIIGVTIFARTDARISLRSRLATGLIVLLAGMLILASVPRLTADRPPLSIEMTHGRWYFLWAALAIVVCRRCAIAVVDPVPQRVQAAVRHCVHSIIALDAAVCVGYTPWHALHGYVVPIWAFIVLALLIPTMLLTRWLNAT